MNHVLAFRRNGINGPFVRHVGSFTQHLTGGSYSAKARIHRLKAPDSLMRFLQTL